MTPPNMSGPRVELSWRLNRYGFILRMIAATVDVSMTTVSCHWT